MGSGRNGNAGLAVTFNSLRSGGEAPEVIAAARPPNSDVSRFEALKALWAEVDIVDVETRELVVQRTFANFDDYWLCMVISTPTRIAEKLSDAESKELKRRLQARLPASASGEITIHASATAVKGRKAR